MAAGRASGLKNLLALGACALALVACSNPDQSYDAAAMDASQGGHQKTAVGLAKKEVERLLARGQCSADTRLECGTLALAYGSLAEYQILDGDKQAGAESFSRAKGAIAWADKAERASAIGMVYRDVAEAYWKVGERTRAREVINEGQAAGGDGWLFTAAAAARS